MKIFLYGSDAYEDISVENTYMIYKLTNDVRIRHCRKTVRNIRR